MRIRPLIAMDVTVMEKRYMGLGAGEQAREKFCLLQDACRAVGGCFTLLWHNSGFTTSAQREIYESLLS